ncbi:hypothetical protein NDU88_002232 [Pleurodeles waltl]|uniref:Uncharacterized protein n=2 Tax=Pleurodeles waltl TaxID=8319 RepID=A0AAV7VBX0_PLEWA|nr:hypothetical protein NDU88_002232 [Pleurodeles waltl]
MVQAYRDCCKCRFMGLLQLCSAERYCSLPRQHSRYGKAKLRKEQTPLVLPLRAQDENAAIQLLDFISGYRAYISELALNISGKRKLYSDREGMHMVEGKERTILNKGEATDSLLVVNRKESVDHENLCYKCVTSFSLNCRNEDKLTMMANEEHWVERLLSPHITAQEFSSHPCQSGSFLWEKAKRVGEIYNISKFKNEQKQKITQNVAKQAGGEHQRKCSVKVSVCKKLSKAGGDTVASLGEAYLLSGIEENTNLFISKPKERECVPRETHKHCEEESLKMQLFALKTEISQLKAKLQKRESDFENVQRELLESKRKASCYAIYIEQIEQSAKKDATIESLQEELHEKSKTVSSLNKELYMEKKASADLILLNKRLQQQLHELKQRNDLKGLRFTETVKTQYNSQLKKLTNKVEAVKNAMHVEYDPNIPNYSAYDLHRNTLS